MKKSQNEKFLRGYREKKFGDPDLREGGEIEETEKKPPRAYAPVAACQRAKLQVIYSGLEFEKHVSKLELI